VLAVLDGTSGKIIEGDRLDLEQACWPSPRVSAQKRATYL
jgi:hypothetical protein